VVVRSTSFLVFEFPGEVAVWEFIDDFFLEVIQVFFEGFRVGGEFFRVG